MTMNINRQIEERLQKNLGNRSPLEYRKLKEKMSIIELST